MLEVKQDIFNLVVDLDYRPQQYCRFKIQESSIEEHMIDRGHVRSKKNKCSNLVGTSNEVNVIMGTT